MGLSLKDFFGYQHQGVRWIVENVACGLFWPMGRAKTVTTLTAIDALLMLGDARRVLIIGPKLAVKHTWPDEIALWPHLRHLTYTVLSGEREDRIDALTSAVKTPLYLINRENVAWLLRECGKHKKWPFDMVVVDESSSFGDNSSTRTKALKKLRKAGLIKRIVILTGTPGNLLKLWSQIFLLDGGERLGRTFETYKQEWFVPNHDATKWFPREGAKDVIYNAIADLISALPEDDTRLPPAVVDVPVDVPPLALERYNQLERDALLPVAEGLVVTAQSAAILINKLLQMSSGFIYRKDIETETNQTYAIHDAKLDALDDLVGDLDRNVLVGYNFEAEYLAIRQRHPEAVEIREPGAIERWNRGEIRMLLAHPASAGHSLNLQFGGHNLIWFSLPWSMELYLQMNKRLDRPGQKYLVSIFRLIARGTADADMPKRLARQIDDQEAMLDFLRERTALRYSTAI